jgi:hypothetical protein
MTEKQKQDVPLCHRQRVGQHEDSVAAVSPHSKVTLHLQLLAWAAH